MNNILINGAEFDNKGAQSMLLTLLAMLQKVYPNKNVVILTGKSNSNMGLNLGNEVAFQSNMYVAKYAKTLVSLVWFYYSLIVKRTSFDKQGFRDYVNLLNNSSHVYDISGYSFGEQFIFASSYIYLMKLKVFNKTRLNVILLPQSFGNFDNSNFLQRNIIKRLAEKYFPKCTRIYAREKSSFGNIERYSPGNLTLKRDIVYEFGNSFNIANLVNPINYDLSVNFDIKKNSVALIPNTKLLKLVSRSLLIEYYNVMIDQLINLNKNIYLVYHSNEDFYMLKELYNQYYDNPKLFFVSEELNVYQLRHLLSKMDFNIASRYHSIIHSYLGFRPCLVIGWATKYNELLETVSQIEFLIDLINETLSKNKLTMLINKLNKNYKGYSKIIKYSVQNLNIESVEKYLLGELK